MRCGDPPRVLGAASPPTRRLTGTLSSDSPVPLRTYKFKHLLGIRLTSSGPILRAGTVSSASDDLWTRRGGAGIRPRVGSPHRTIMLAHHHAPDRGGILARRVHCPKCVRPGAGAWAQPFSGSAHAILPARSRPRRSTALAGFRPPAPACDPRCIFSRGPAGTVRPGAPRPISGRRDFYGGCR